jgi:hypothetical protein
MKWINRNIVSRELEFPNEGVGRAGSFFFFFFFLIVVLGGGTLG